MARGPYYNPGRYWCKVVNQQLGESSTGKPQIVITFQVMGRINPADPEGELLSCGENKERSVFRSITAKTIDWVTRDLATLGFTGTSFKQIDLSAAGACDLRGKELAFSCQHSTNQEGDLREEWSVSSDGGGITVKPLEAKAVRDLDNLFGRQLKAMATAAPKADEPKAEALGSSRKRSGAKGGAMEHPFPDSNAQAPTEDERAPWDEDEASPPDGEF